jgi:retinol dehydrogenase 12
VYLVTGSNTGIGKEVANVLYSQHAKVYIAARSAERATTAITHIKESNPESKGFLEFLHLDLADLSTIKGTVEEFLAKETKLHVLFNNAGLQTPNPGTTKQGYEIQLGVNCLGTFLLTKLLTPILIQTAQAEQSLSKTSSNTVRVVWVCSAGTEMGAEKSVGLHMDNLDYHILKNGMYKYSISKVGDYLYGVEYAKRHRNDGIVSVPLNPGNLASDLYRDQTNWLFQMFLKMITHPVKLGAYTELYAGVSEDVTIEKSGSWRKFC